MDGFREIPDGLRTGSREPFFELAARYHDPARRTLDIGPGIAGFADRLNDPDVYLVDHNPETVAVLRQRYRNVFQHSVPDRFPFEDGMFWLIHSSHFVEHLTPADLYAFLVECDRVLAPGGRMVISTPVMWAGFYNEMSHIKPYQPHVFEKYLCDPPGERSNTRIPIARTYRVADLVWRYHRESLPYLSLGDHPRLNRLLARAVNFLRDRGVGLLRRSGYTLVLEKQPVPPPAAGAGRAPQRETAPQREPEPA